MKTINFNHQEYQVPESWSDCTLAMIVEAGVLQEILPDAPIVSVISAYCNIPSIDVAQAQARDLKEILSCLSFIETEYVPQSTSSFEFRGQTYSCGEKIEEIRFDQWVSVNTILYNYKESPVRGLPRMLASLCMKEGETIATLDLDARTEEFMELPLPVARDVEGFFLDHKIESEAVSRLYSIVREQERLIPKQLTELRSIMTKRKAQASTNWRTKRLIGAMQIYLKSFQRQWEKSYNSSATSD